MRRRAGAYKNSLIDTSAQAEAKDASRVKENGCRIVLDAVYGTNRTYEANRQKSSSAAFAKQSRAVGRAEDACSRGRFRRLQGKEEGNTACADDGVSSALLARLLVTELS